MELKDYPQSIASLRYQALEIEQEESRLRSTIEDLEMAIEQKVQDAELKNEGQRNLMRYEQGQYNNDLLRSRTELLELRHQKKKIEISLEQKRSELSIALALLNASK